MMPTRRPKLNRSHRIARPKRSRSIDARADRASRHQFRNIAGAQGVSPSGQQNRKRRKSMFERIIAIICIASVLISACLGFLLIWGPQSDLLGRMFLSSILTFLATGSLFSIMTTLRRRSGA
jgi:hypothetical protein